MTIPSATVTRLSQSPALLYMTFKSASPWTNEPLTFRLDPLGKLLNNNRIRRRPAAKATCPIKALLIPKIQVSKPPCPPTWEDWREEMQKSSDLPRLNSSNLAQRKTQWSLRMAGHRRNLRRLSQRRQI